MSGVGNIGGNQPINDRPIQQNGLRRNDVQENLRSIFDQYDTNGDKVLNDNDGAGTVQKFWTAAKNFLNNLKGTDKTEHKGNAQDVANATITQQPEEPTKFDKNGNVIPEVTENPDGSTTTRHGGETVNAKDGNITVTDANGKSVGGIKQLPNGLQVLTQADGTQGVYDPKKGEFLPEDKAQEILAQLG